MLDIKITSLTIKNFKGIDDLKIDLNGKSALIKGKNATGKSSIIDSFYWLISNKNSDFKANFNIISLNDSNSASVEVKLLVNDNDIVKIKKVHSKKFKKNKGSISKFFDGFTTNHFVNDLAVNQNEYIKRINAIIDIDMFRLLSDINFFNQCNVDFRRNILFSTIKKIDNKDIIKSDKQLESLSGKDIPNYKKSLNHRQKTIDKRLNELSVLISECRKNHDSKSAEDIDKYESKRNSILSKLKSFNADIELKKELKELELENFDDEIRFKKENQEKNDRLKSTQIDVENQIHRCKGEIEYIINDIENCKVQIKSYEAELKDLLKEWKSISTMEYSVCSLCKQDIPVSNRLLVKANNLKAINDKGFKIKSSIDKLISTIETLKSNKNIYDAELSNHEESLHEISKKIHDMNNENGKAYANKQLKYMEKVKSIQESLNKPDLERDKLNEELTMIEEKIKSINKKNIVIELNEKNITTYNNEIKQLQTDYQENEKQLDLIEIYDTNRAKIIEEKISSLFKITDWKLFEIKRNESVKKICEPYFEGVPFSDLNTGAKINVMIDIIDTISENTKVITPLFIDNAESITNWIDTDKQIIKLIADKNHDDLCIELI